MREGRGWEEKRERNKRKKKRKKGEEEEGGEEEEEEEEEEEVRRMADTPGIPIQATSPQNEFNPIPIRRRHFCRFHLAVCPV